MAVIFAMLGIVDDRRLLSPVTSLTQVYSNNSIISDSLEEIEQ
jgi:hypothetical protein